MNSNGRVFQLTPGEVHTAAIVTQDFVAVNLAVGCYVALDLSTFLLPCDLQHIMIHDQLAVESNIFSYLGQLDLLVSYLQ